MASCIFVNTSMINYCQFNKKCHHILSYYSYVWSRALSLLFFLYECTPLQFSHIDGSLASSCKHDKNKTCHQRVDELLMSQWAACNLEFGKPQCQTSSRYSGGKGQSSN